MDTYKWLPVDTPSIMFSSLSTTKWGRTCRTVVVFKEVEIDPQLLRQAVNDLRGRFPHYFSKLRHGFFWNYLEQTEGEVEIRPENGRPGQPIVLHKDNRPGFRLVYDGRMLALESAHYISDGYGLLNFLLSLAQHYLELCGAVPAERDAGVYYWQDAPDAQETADEYIRYSQTDKEKKKPEHKKVYHFAPVYEKNCLRLLYFFADSEAVHAKAQSYRLSVTEFMTAACMLAAVRAAGNPIHAPIVFDIPVNLRGYFSTTTLRNFVFQVSTVLPVDGRTDWTLAEIADCIRGQIKAQIKPEDLRAILKNLTALARNPVVGVIPNFIKNPVLRIMQAYSHAGETGIITNLGNVKVSEALANQIDHLEAVNGDTSKYGLPTTCSSISFNGRFSFCVNTNNHDTRVWDELEKILRAEGIAVERRSSDETIPADRLSPAAPDNGKRAPWCKERMRAYFHH